MKRKNNTPHYGWGMKRRWAGTAALAPLAYKVGQKLGSEVARRVAERASRSYTKTKTEKPKKKRSARLRRNYKTLYAGKFARPNKRSGRMLDRFYKHGVSMVEETVGTAVDTDCVYAMAEVMSPFRLIQCTLGGVVKLLFNKAGFCVTGWDDNPWGIISGLPTGDGQYYMALNEYEVSAASVSSAVTVDSLTASTLRQVVDAFVAYVQQWIASYGAVHASNDKWPHSMEIYKTVRNSGDTGTAFVRLADIVLDQVGIDLAASLTLKTQNRTVSVSGSTDAEDVTANPVQGRMYVFRGIPRVKGYSVETGGLAPYKFGVFYCGHFGVEIFRPDNMDPAYLEPPPPANFYNCQKSSKIRMQPGEIKHYGLTDSRKNVPLTRLWKSIRYIVTDNGELDFYTYNVFKVLMLAIEDVINTTSDASKVTIGMEVERRLSCIATERKKKFTKPVFFKTDLGTVEPF